MPPLDGKEQLSEISGIDQKSFLPPPGPPPPPLRLSCSNFRSFWNEREWRETSARLARRDDFLPEKRKGHFPDKRATIFANDISHFLLPFVLPSYSDIDEQRFHVVLVAQNAKQKSTFPLSCCCAVKMKETLRDLSDGIFRLRTKRMNRKFFVFVKSY
ncbi:hypothetical protein CDAR_579161 [Caerostris darwini]|uniref:Uncharacterized protein n=1 Tax=Caerostris darwini TaxID=1538125 RepID=A0AAV4RPE0_9ARAC|nr:hypothetical protein CDAR_579161 [Caerostris darwini]